MHDKGHEGDVAAITNLGHPRRITGFRLLRLAILFAFNAVVLAMCFWRTMLRVYGGLQKLRCNSDMSA